MTGDFAAAQPHLTRAEAALDAGTLSPVTLARVYAMRGDAARAMQLLNRAASVRDRRLLYVNISPFYQPLQPIPEFQSLLGQMRLSS